MLNKISEKKLFINNNFYYRYVCNYIVIKILKYEL